MLVKYCMNSLLKDGIILSKSAVTGSISFVTGAMFASVFLSCFKFNFPVLACSKQRKPKQVSGFYVAESNATIGSTI